MTTHVIIVAHVQSPPKLLLNRFTHRNINEQSATVTTRVRSTYIQSTVQISSVKKKIVYIFRKLMLSK